MGFVRWIRAGLWSFFALALLMFPTTTAAQPQINWRLSFSDDFKGTHIDERSWAVYGKDGPKGPHCWDSRNITVSGAIVTRGDGADLGSFIDDGFAVGQRIRITGTGTPIDTTVASISVDGGWSL